MHAKFKMFICVLLIDIFNPITGAHEDITNRR
jgi:hypothetical protein